MVLRVKDALDECQRLRFEKPLRNVTNRLMAGLTSVSAVDHHEVQDPACEQIGFNLDMYTHPQPWTEVESRATKKATFTSMKAHNTG